MVAILLRNRKRLLVCLNVAFVCGILASFLYAFIDQPQLELPQQSQPRKAAVSETSAKPKARPLSYYSVIYSRNLRGSLEGEKPQEIPKLVLNAPGLNIKLLGTVVETGHTYALFRDNSGKEKLISLGGKIDGAELAQVVNDIATLIVGGKSYALKVEKKKPQQPPQNSRPAKPSRRSRRNKK